MWNPHEISALIRRGRDQTESLLSLCLFSVRVRKQPSASPHLSWYLDLELPRL